MKEHFKGVIWPRGSQEATVKNKGKATIYRYVVVGMLVTDEPIPNVEGKEELFCDGPVEGMTIPLEVVRKRKPKYRIGNANSVLTGLGDL